MTCKDKISSLALNSAVHVIYFKASIALGVRGDAVVWGRGFDSRWSHWNFSLTHDIMALRLTQLLTQMSISNISWVVKATRAKGWQPYLLHTSTVLKSGSLSILEASGPSQACNGIALPVPSTALDTSTHISSAWISLTYIFSNRN